MYPFSYIPLCFACCNKSLGEKGNAQHCRLRSSKQRKRQSCTVPFSSRTLFVTIGSQRKKILLSRSTRNIALIQNFFSARYCFCNLFLDASDIVTTMSFALLHLFKTLAMFQHIVKTITMFKAIAKLFVKDFFAIHEICGQNLRYKVCYKRHYWRKRQRPTKTLSFAQKHVQLASLDALGGSQSWRQNK